MKKLLSLALVVVMLLAMASFSFGAGTITWGGNLRFWYMNTMGPDNGMSSFQFDRVAITFKDALSDHDGISAELQWRNYAGNDTGTSDIQTTTKVSGTTATSTTKEYGTKQARLDSGYYYYDGILGKDELQIGALSKLPFRLGLSKNCNFVDTGLGSKLKVGNCAGVSYELAADRFTVGAGIANGYAKDTTNIVGQYEGFTYSMRLDAGKNFFGLVPGLRLGTGYNRQRNGVDDNYVTNQVIDAAYVQSLYWASVEKGFSTTTTNGTDGDCLTGMYFEAGINLGKNKIWAGRMITDYDAPLFSYKDQFATTSKSGTCISKIASGNIIAAIVPVFTSSNLQFQYIMGDKHNGDDTGKEVDVRFQTSF